MCLPIFLIRKMNWVCSSTSRKLLHIGNTGDKDDNSIAMASVYLFCWPFFPSQDNAKWIAASSNNSYNGFNSIVPMAFTIVFFGIGQGFLRIPFIADSMSRSGKVEEVAGGPVHYGLCISLATVLFWKRVEAFYCILPIAMGDGFAAFFGPSISHNRPLWWNPTKTWFGLLSFIFFSYIGLIFYISIFSSYCFYAKFIF